MVEVHLAITLIHRHSTFYNLKKKFKLKTSLRTPSARRQSVGYLQSVGELNLRGLETNPDQMLEQDLNPGLLHANPSP